MITTIHGIVKGDLETGKLGGRLLLISIMVCSGILGMLTSVAVAQEGVKMDNLSGLAPAGMEKRFPMTAEAEAAIVHVVPSCPVVIDGVVYKPEEISLFNGKRLRFVVGGDRTLYAFTTVEAFEQFVGEMDTLSMTLTSESVAQFYIDWYWGGNCISAFPGSGIADLGPWGFDKAISSTRILTTTQWAYLFDYANYGGDYFAMAPGSSYYLLTPYGWNDRASSVWVNQ